MTMTVYGPEDANAIGNNLLYIGGETVGRATVGDYGFAWPFSKSGIRPRWCKIAPGIQATSVALGGSHGGSESRRANCR